MVRTPCCDKDTVTKGTWSAEEDATLKSYVEKHGAITNWITLPQKIGLNRCGKSCRLRWLNYLRPHIKHGKFTEEEDKIISDLYFSVGSRWSIMADRLPGRTDNDIKNYWNTKLKKKIAGDNKKTQKRPSFRGLNGDVGVDNSPPAFTITNGHLMSTSWPSNTELHSQQELDEGLTPTGANLEHSAPILLSFSTRNATTTATCSSSSEGGASTSSALPDPPMTGQLVFPINTAFSGGGATHGLTIPDPPMNDIIKDGQSTTCQFCFHDKGSSSNSHDLINNWHSMPDIGIDIDIDTDVHTNMGMNIDINVDVGVGVDGGSTSTDLEPEASSTSLRELWDLLFDDSPTPSAATTTPSPVDVIDGPDDILRHHFESLGSWDDDATITSLISSLPVEDNNIVDLLSDSCNYQDNFLPQDVLDQFS